MKKLLFVTVLLSLVPSAIAYAVPVDSGYMFKIGFDLSAEAAPAPYLNLGVTVRFNDSDPLDIGEGYTMQVFDSNGNIASDQRSFIYSDIYAQPCATGMVYGIALNPAPGLFDGIGSVVFTNIIGTFDLKLDNNWVQGVMENSGVTTNWVLGDTAVFPVPEPTTMFLLGTGLFGLASLGMKKFKKS